MHVAQGLIHASELMDTVPADVASVVAVGDRVDVMVLSCEAGKVGVHECHFSCTSRHRMHGVLIICYFEHT